MSRQPQRIIAGASLLGGVALVALAVSIQRDPLILTHAGQYSAAVVQPAAAAEQKPQREQSTAPRQTSAGAVLELPPVRITAPRSVAQPQKPESPAWQPCSEWQELGPTYVEEGKAQGTRRVRHLC